MYKEKIYVCMTFRHILISILMSTGNTKNSHIFVVTNHQDIDSSNVDFDELIKLGYKVSTINEAVLQAEFTSLNWKFFPKVISNNLALARGFKLI
ncbi:hypothetical protein P0F25_003002, partial [Vibrio metschnikovii]|nr:hypothetical protein [Vibrio metschnikovii]